MDARAMKRTWLCALAMLLLGLRPGTAAEHKPVPRLQVIPEPYHQVSFQRDGMEIARYHHGPELRRPFIYPVIGPAGRPLTRMGHPRDPWGHRHHNSVWISHQNINGVDFWADAPKVRGTIIHQRVEMLEDEGGDAGITTLNHWVADADGRVLLIERRRTQAQLLEDNQWMLCVDLQFTAPEPVSFGRTAFGLIGVRMAKTIGTLDGGGTIRNSEGQVNEKEIFWKPARWVDYSGPITPSAVEGITLMDHPANPNHPSIFHVRGDGWMGASFTNADARTLEPGQMLRLRYGLYIHAGQPTLEEIEQRWQAFARSPLMQAR
jgi:hypothetical protein